MFLVLIAVNVALYYAIVLYCRLSSGVNKCSKHLVGKVVIVVGGRCGIGFEVAKDLAERGARVIITSRKKKAGEAARDKIATLTSNNNIVLKKLDLALFSSIREFASDILKSENRLDILINNAATTNKKKVITGDGLLLEMQTNHFGPFLLTNLLLPLLKSSAPSRIINVASVAYTFSNLDFDNLKAEKIYSSYKVYSTSKLCNILMAIEMAKRLEGTGVTINAAHPGIVITESWAGTPFLNAIGKIAKTRWEGIQTITYLAVSPEVEGVSGKYFVDCHEKVTSRKVKDEDAQQLWEISEKVCQINVSQGHELQEEASTKLINRKAQSDNEQ